MSASTGTDLESRIIRVIRDFAGAKPGDVIDLREAVHQLDSLDKLDLIYRMEGEFNIKMDNIDNIESYDDLIRVLIPKISA